MFTNVTDSSIVYYDMAYHELYQLREVCIVMNIQLQVAVDFLHHSTLFISWSLQAADYSVHTIIC